VSVRHNDLWTLSHSSINERMQAMQTDLYDFLYYLYGDSAYLVMNCILSRHCDDDRLSELQVLENDCMSAVRETIEWVNNDIKSKFAFIGFHKGLKLRTSDKKVCKLIIVSAILTNCFKCLNGCQTSMYFDLKPPDLETYLNFV
jgi:hypothetical protein